MNKLERINNLLQNMKLDALLISNGYNMRYISGFSGATGYLFISNHRKVILTDSRYTIQANAESLGFEVLEVINNDYIALLNELLQESKAHNLGIEENDLLYGKYLKLKENLKVEEFVPVGSEITNLRIIKEEDELKYIKKAEEIGDLAFTKILDIIKPGMTELEVAAHLEFIMKTNGAEGLSFDTIVASGVRSSMPHATPTDKKIELGDFVTMDFGCLYKGYCSDMTRTIVVGKASDKQKEIYHTVLKAQLAALDFIKAGIKGQDIDAVARNIIYSAGYDQCFGHGLGHSVGLEIHEDPRLSPTETSLILENTIETVEPGIYVKDFGGVRIEDLVLVTKEGHINFTHSEKKLIEL